MAFTLEIPNEEQIKSEVVEQLKPEASDIAALQKLTDSNVNDIMAVDLESLENRRTILKSVEEFGMDSMRSSSDENSLLKVRVGDLSKAGDEGGTVAKGLVNLQIQLEDLDPSAIDFAKTGFLGKLFNPLRAYFAKYQKADAVIADILNSLEKGKRTLINDNTTLEIAQSKMRDLTKKMHKEIQLGMMMDDAVNTQIEAAKAKGEDEYKIKFITEEVMFPLRQRIIDMNQMLVVNQQGIMAMEVVIRNNKELIRGVDRARTVTISALRIAVTVASALYHQKIVLQKVTALNETTNNIISSTSKMLKEQGVEIQKQAINANISVETLKTAFTDVISALDSISVFKQAALPKMKETIIQFRELADVGEKQLQQLEKGQKLDI